MLLPISPVETPNSFGNNFLCSKVTFIGVKNSVPLKNADTEISTPFTFRCN